MSQIFKIPMTKEFLEELEDTYVDQEKSAHRFIFELITNLCRDAKNCKLSKSTPVNRWKNKQRVQEVVKFKDIKLGEYTLPSNPKWLPKDTDAEDMTFFELKLRDKTWEYLILHGQVLTIRVKEYNESTTKHEATILQGLRDNGTAKEGIKNQEEQNQTALEKRVEQIPKCIEQAVFEQIFPQIHQAVQRNIDQVFNAEFDAEYADEEKKRSSEIKKRAQDKKKKVADDTPKPSPQR